MTRYPSVINEADTLKAILNGASIARYGDGELKMCKPGLPAVGIKSQYGDEALSTRLREILIDSGACLVGIPNIHDVVREHVSDQKVEHWARYAQYRTYLAERPYYSSFITRPDSAPWIHTAEYWHAFETLWIGQDVTVVRGSGKSLTTDDLIGARSVTEILAPRQQAWFDYDEILTRVLAVKPSRVLIGLGPTATVLAVDLCKHGIHALDLGHAAMFLRHFRRGEAGTLTPEEKALPT